MAEAAALIEQRLTRLETREDDIIKRINALAQEFKEHRREDDDAQRRIGDAIEKLEIDMALYNKEQERREKYRAKVQTATISVLVTLLTLAANYLMK